MKQKVRIIIEAKYALWRCRWSWVNPICVFVIAWTVVDVAIIGELFWLWLPARLLDGLADLSFILPNPLESFILQE